MADSLLLVIPLSSFWSLPLVLPIDTHPDDPPGSAWNQCLLLECKRLRLAQALLAGARALLANRQALPAALPANQCVRSPRARLASFAFRARRRASFARFGRQREALLSDGKHCSQTRSFARRRARFVRQQIALLVGAQALLAGACALLANGKLSSPAGSFALRRGCFARRRASFARRRKVFAR